MEQMTEPYDSLAPLELLNAREVRFDGGGFEVTLADFAQVDRDTILEIYKATRQVYDLWLYMQHQPDFGLLLRVSRVFAAPDFVKKVVSVGAATYEEYGYPQPSIQAAMHDLKGGAMTSLIGYAEFVGTSELEVVQLEQDILRMVKLARDHAKMMRNLLPELDPLVREADERNRLHLVDGFLEKWSDFVFHIEGRKVRVKVDSQVSGYLTSCCLETSSVDRILFNYINNAARFAASGEVRLTIYFTSPGILRWVVENELSEDHEQWLEERLGGDLTRLFEGGMTRGGQGIGLSNCVSLVASSFGVSESKALKKKYLGARVLEHTYYAWFHWPAVTEEEAEQGTPCHCEPSPDA